MNTINSPTPSTDILSLKDFCEAIEKVYDIEITNIDSILNTPDGWTKLVDLWEEQESDGDITPLYQAASYIKYAYDFEFCSDLEKTLMLAVCRELCSDGPAGHAWRTHPFFTRVLKEAEPEDDSEYLNRIHYGEGSHVSSQHCYYLEQRLMLRYLQDKGICNKEYKNASSYIAAYEAFIARLYPEASKWPSDYWVDVDNIYDALHHEYQIDYRTNPREYDVLLCVFRMETSAFTLTEDREHDYLRCVFNLEHFSLPWARAIWPTDTEKTIIKMYYLAKDFVDQDCAFEDILRPCHVYDVDDHVFTHSWIYSIVQNWIATGELHTRYENDHKKAMFEISLNI